MHGGRAWKPAGKPACKQDCLPHVGIGGDKSRPGRLRACATEGLGMNLLVGAWTIGLILSMLALGVFISFRIFHFPDITADGSITLGAAVAATLLVRGVAPLLATTAGFAAGMLAGATTALLHTRFKINGLLAGILVMTALYSINLHVMGKSNVPLISQATLASDAERMGARFLGSAGWHIFAWEINA